MKKLILLPLLFLVACQENAQQELNSWDQENPAIIGGTEVSQDSPLARTAFLLRRLYNRKETVDGEFTKVTYSTFKCTASALSRRVIITAAHCVSTSADIHRIELKDAEGAPDYYNASEIVVHPDYEKNKKADLAMLLLERDLPENTITVTLPGTSWPLGVSSFTAAGFGVTTGIASLATNNTALKTTEVKVYSYQAEEMLFKIDQTKGKGICSGDSGGPGLIESDGKALLLGVASGVVYFKSTDGSEVDTCNYMGEYVNIPLFHPWITETQQMLEAREQK